MSNLDPYRDHDRERAKYLGLWFGISLATLFLLTGLIYFAGRSGNVAFNSPPVVNSGVSTTGSAPSR